jgi:hypothetical protein
VIIIPGKPKILNLAKDTGYIGMLNIENTKIITQLPMELVIDQDIMAPGFNPNCVS